MIPLSAFKFIRTIGMGTFGRVYLVNLKTKEKRKHIKFYALKIMQKSKIEKLRQISHFHNEANLLAYCRPNPFFAKLYNAFDTDMHHCLLFEYVRGGELFFWLKNNRKFGVYAAQFYLSQICKALQYLHRRGVIYRDLKPENILVNLDGYLKITDLGFAKKVDTISYTVCGTVEYMAPEEFNYQGHGREVDYWSVGIVLYEMVCGLPPFYDSNTKEIHRMICQDEVKYPSWMLYSTKDLISKLLVKDKKKRMGRKGGFREILGHSFFDGVDFDLLMKKELMPPFVPSVKSMWDTVNFSSYDENDPVEPVLVPLTPHCKFSQE